MLYGRNMFLWDGDHSLSLLYFGGRLWMKQKFLVMLKC